MIYENVELYNTAEILVGPDGKRRMSRIPDAVRQGLNTLAQRTSFNGCGSEIRFVMKSDEVRLKLRLVNDDEFDGEHASLEVYYGCFQDPNPRSFGRGNQDIRLQTPEHLEHLIEIAKQHSHPYDPRLVRVVLPYGAHVMLEDVQGEVEPPKPHHVPQRKWLAYGSSITTGSSAVSATGTYAMRAASLLGVDLINMGFSGSARLEPAMADYLAARGDWDFATLELGINMIWDMETSGPGDPDLFAERVDYFVSAIADRNPDKPIFCIDMFPYMGDMTKDELADRFRSIVADKVRRLDRPKVIHLSGLALMDSLQGLASDLIHPSERGMEQIATKLHAAMLPYLT